MASASSSAPALHGVAPLRAGQGTSFALRRLHSLTGIVPVGAFAAYVSGFRGTLVIAGPGAAAKARRCGEIILERLARAGVKPEHSHVECLGAGETCITPSSPCPNG